jgi:hypothetical protein
MGGEIKNKERGTGRGWRRSLKYTRKSLKTIQKEYVLLERGSVRE